MNELGRNMDSIYTDRLVMKSNVNVNNGVMEFPKNLNGLDILKIEPTVGEDGGFMFYDRCDKEKKICHIGIRDDRRPMEITYGTEENYREKKYMQEALFAFMTWIFSSTDTKTLNALIVNNKTSQHILKKYNFQLDGRISAKNEEWYTLDKNSWCRWI